MVKVMKKVLFISHGIPPHSYGGVEVYTNNIYQEFKKSKGYHPLVLSRTENNPYWEGLIYADKVDPSLFYIHTCTSDLFHLVQHGLDDCFRDFILNIKPDVIHFQHYLHLSLSWFKIAKELLPNSKVLLTLHEYIGLCPNSGLMIKTPSQKNKLCYKSGSKPCSDCFPHLPLTVITDRISSVKRYFSYIDTFISPSEFLRNRYLDSGLVSQPIIVSENGLALSVPVTNANTNNDENLRLLFLGQINTLKGLHVLLDAIARLNSNKVSLSIYGKMQDNHKYNYEILRKVNILPNVTFMGSYSQEELPQILNSHHILVVPSVWWENSPLVIQEAFAANLPIICSNIGGMAEKVVNNVNGLHFKINDSKSLADVINKCLLNPHLLIKLKKGINVPKSIEQNRLELENIYSK